MKVTNDPAIWGPHFWTTLHTIAEFYPENPTEEDIQSFENLFNSLKYLLPCEKCKLHYRELQLHARPFSQAEAVKIVNDLHDKVNSRLGKTFTDAVEKDVCTSCSSSVWENNWTLIIILILSFLLLAFSWYAPLSRPV